MGEQADPAAPVGEDASVNPPSGEAAPSGGAAPNPDDAGGSGAAGGTPLDSTGVEKELYDRLLGESGEGSDGDAVAAPPPGLGIKAPSVPGWLWVVGILGGLGLLLLRSRSLKALRGPDAISVVSRSQLGKDGSLAVIEVAEADGEKRRLLVGFGGGAPRLVADLGRPFPDLPEPAPAPLVDRVEALGPRAVPRSDAASEAPGDTPVAPGPAGRANAAGAWARAVRDAGGAPSAPTPTAAQLGRLERRHDLIEEVLAERGDDDVQGVGG